jgi:hypothetical protein
MRYYLLAVVGAVLLGALMTAQWAAVYLGSQTPAPSLVAIVLGWIVIAVSVAIPAAIGWLKARRSALPGNAVVAGALFGALAAFAAGPVPALLLPLFGPVTVSSVGISAGFAGMMAPFTAAFCAGVAWVSEVFFTRLFARRTA